MDLIVLIKFFLYAVGVDVALCAFRFAFCADGTYSSTSDRVLHWACGLVGGALLYYSMWQPMAALPAVVLAGLWVVGRVHYARGVL